MTWEGFSHLMSFPRLHEVLCLPTNLKTSMALLQRCTMHQSIVASPKKIDTHARLRTESGLSPGSPRARLLADCLRWKGDLRSFQLWPGGQDTHCAEWTWTGIDNQLNRGSGRVAVSYGVSRWTEKQRRNDLCQVQFIRCASSATVFVCTVTVHHAWNESND